LKSNKSTRFVTRMLSVAVLAALVSPAFPVKQADAASFSTQNQSPLISINGSTGITINQFFGQIFNLDKWIATNSGNLNNADQAKPEKDKTDQGKPDKDKPGKPDQGKPDKDKPGKPDPGKPDKDKPGKPDPDSKKEYEAITNAATKQLIDLRNESKSELMGIAIQAKGTKDAKERATLYQQGQNTFNQKEAQFNAIVNDVTNKLQSKGFSTDIVDQYKAEFNQDVELGKSLLQNVVVN
jgi:hypothetical protein